MNLRAFHILFILFSLGLSCVLAWWNFRAWNLGGASWHLWIGIAAVVGAVALIIYGQWFIRKVRTPPQDKNRGGTKLYSTSIILLGIALAPKTAEACTVCYGQAEGPMIEGAKVGVFALYGLVLLVQIGLIAFFWTLRRRAKRYAKTNATRSLEGTT